MARIALIDTSGRAATTVQAVLGRDHEVVVRQQVHAPGDAELVIADLRGSELADQSILRSLTSFGPVLLLVDKLQPIPPGIDETSGLSVLRKPFDSFELRLKVEALLARAAAPPTGGAPGPREEEDAAWLEFPFVPVTAGAVLRRGARMSAPLWILGETGCGRRRIAMAVCRAALPPLRLVTLYPDEKLATVIEREQSATPFALLVPEIEQRPILEQERLAAVLAGPRGFRLLATSIDDPAQRVVDGTFSRSLYQQLIGLAVQISPLREQPVAIPPLVQALTRRIARSLGVHGDVSFSPEAMARLQTYMWPGNIVELEAVLNRTLAYIGESDLSGRTIEADELLFTPGDAGRGRARAALGSGAATLTRLPSLERQERQERDDPDERAQAPIPTSAGGGMGRQVTPAPEPRALEQVMAGLAHDLRNPMVAIKTFAGAISSGRAGDASARELGLLARDACDRIDGHLEALQQYSDFGQPTRERIDVADVVRAAVAELPAQAAERVSVEAPGRQELSCDSMQFRFVIDNLIEASLAEAGDSGAVAITVPARGSITFDVPTGQGPVTKLRKLVGNDENDAPSWRIVLARAVAERNGCAVDVRDEDGTTRISCALPGGEEQTRGEQTSRINR